MAIGNVKWFNAEKGFGSITPESGGPDIFVHYSVIEGESKLLVENQRVEFEVTQGPKGPEAEAVHPL